MISVTRRLRAASEADRLFVLQGGVLVEHGTHQALLAQARQATLAKADRLRRQRLRQMPVFAAVSLDDLEAVAGQFESEYYAANETIFAQGDSGEFGDAVIELMG